MKVKFSKSIEFHPTWGNNHELADGDKYKVTIRPLNNLDMMALQDGIRTEDNKADVKKVMAVSGDFIPRYASISNLYDDDGEVTIEQVASMPFYLDLALEIMNKMIEISTPTKRDEKN